MYLRKTKVKDRIYLAAVQGYRVDGKSMAKTIKSFGYLDELMKDYSDPIAHFTELVRHMDKERKTKEIIELSFSSKDVLDVHSSDFKNYGYVVLSYLYHYLGIHDFINDRRRYEDFDFNANAVMKLLVYSRILYPGSKKHTYELKDRFFDKFEFERHDMYRALDFFAKHEDALQKHIHQKMVEKEGRKTNLLFYDVTNYYFESEVNDDLRTLGPSKEKKKRPIIQMGMAIDEQGIPVSYKLFKGNTHDSQTLPPILGQIRREYNTERIIVVADKGLYSGDNMAFTTITGCGYVISRSIKNASADLKAFALDHSGFKLKHDDDGNVISKMKSRIIDNDIKVTNFEVKSKRAVSVKQKEVIVYSEKYAKRARLKRQELIEKAFDLINRPSRYNKATSHGAAAYVKDLKFNDETGEIIESKSKLSINEDFINEQSLFDGYYVIVTSELDKSNEEIRKIYHGLWQIEDTFKVTKSTLESRPVYVHKEDHIKAHFLTCFISLVIARLLEKKLNHQYSINKILDSLRTVNALHLKENIFAFGFHDEITKNLNDIFDLGYGKKAMTKMQIIKHLGDTKKII